MCLKSKKQKNEAKRFENTSLDINKVDTKPKFDLVTIYEKCIEEMTLQQSKRDQIITIYLAMFSFAVTYVLTSDRMDSFIKGLVFFAVAVIGFGFSLVIIRYRMYKEAYWICCEAITNLMCLKGGEIDKKTIQAVYYNCLNKRGNSFIKGEGEERKFNKWTFFKKNIFSGETIYCMIHAFIVSDLFGIGFFLVTQPTPMNGFLMGGISGLVFFVVQVFMYFRHLIKVYGVLVDGTDASFNTTFSKAWFLHLYIDYTF